MVIRPFKVRSLENLLPNLTNFRNPHWVVDRAAVSFGYRNVIPFCIQAQASKLFKGIDL